MLRKLGLAISYFIAVVYLLLILLPLLYCYQHQWCKGPGEGDGFMPAFMLTPLGAIATAFSSRCHTTHQEKTSVVVGFLASGDYFRACSPWCKRFYCARNLLHCISSLGTVVQRLWMPEIEGAAARAMRLGMEAAFGFGFRALASSEHRCLCLCGGKPRCGFRPENKVWAWLLRTLGSLTPRLKIGYPLPPPCLWNLRVSRAIIYLTNQTHFAIFLAWTPITSNQRPCKRLSAISAILTMFWPT